MNYGANISRLEARDHAAVHDIKQPFQTILNKLVSNWRNIPFSEDFPIQNDG
jgi:hypothetical protein